MLKMSITKKILLTFYVISPIVFRLATVYTFFLFEVFLTILRSFRAFSVRQYFFRIHEKTLHSVSNCYSIVKSSGIIEDNKRLSIHSIIDIHTKSRQLFYYYFYFIRCNNELYRSDSKKFALTNSCACR